MFRHVLTKYSAHPYHSVPLSSGSSHFVVQTDHAYLYDLAKRVDLRSIFDLVRPESKAFVDDATQSTFSKDVPRSRMQDSLCGRRLQGRLADILQAKNVDLIT